MKAIVYEKYGTPSVLELQDVRKPTPNDDEVLIQVRAVALNYADTALLTGTPFLIRLEAGLTKPKHTILGADVAGRVEAVGKNVTRFQPGDEVFGDLSGCGWGGLAEYVTAPEQVLALKPGNATFAQAAAVPMAAVTAVQGLRDTGQIQAGQKVLINGASGGVGSFAVQIAKAYETEVTAVCSTGKMEMVRSIGADHAIDYTQEDFAQNGKRYDLILGVNGYRPLADYKRALADEGTYVCAGGTLTQIFQAMLLGPIISMRGPKKLKGMGPAKPNAKDLEFMKALVEAGKVTPVIDKCYPLDEAAEAIRYLAEGHAQGKVVITVA